MSKFNQLKHCTINRFAMGLYCLSALSVVSCENENTKTKVTPTLQKVSFSASSASGKEGITLSDNSTVKLFITTDEPGKVPAHYYEGTNEKAFEAGGTKFTIEKNALSIYSKSAAGEGKKYYIQQFDLDAEGKSSYRLAEVVSFKLKDTDDSKSVTLTLVENKTTIEGETTTETKGKTTTHCRKRKSESSEIKKETSGKPVSFALSKEKVNPGKQFFFYTQFQKSGNGKTPEY